MSLNVAQKPKQNFGRVEDGTFPARVVQIIDLGQQVQTDFQTGEPKVYEDGNTVIKPEVFINFEFPTERIEIDGVDKPRWLGKQYVLSAHEKSSLYSLMQATAPGSSNVGDALTKAATVTVGSTSSGNAKITGVAPLMKGMAVPELENPTTVFDFDEPDMDVFDKLPAWIKSKIQVAVNFNGSSLQKALSGQKAQEASADAASDEPFDDSDIPF